MNIFERWSIDSEYSIAHVDTFPDDEYMHMFNTHMLQGFPILPWRSSQTEEQRSRQSDLKTRLKDRYELKLGLFHDEALVGWTYGWQDSVHDGDFYMGSSLVLPDHRGKNLYSELVKKVFEITLQEGFSAIRSRHLCTNNPILIAKLKLGFMINGFEQDEIMGTLIRMIYHHNEVRKKSASFRAGKYTEQGIMDLMLKS